MHTRKMSQGRLAWAALAPAVLLVGCSHMSPTEKGLLGGAALGAGTGAAIGHAAGNTGVGAVLGTAVGAALSGAAVGNHVERAEARAARAELAAARGPVGLTDVVSMAHQGVSDDVIISQIHSTGAAFQLSPGDIVYLTQNHVGDRVIQAMQGTVRRPRVVGPVPVYQPVYVVEPPPPPVRVGFGVGFCR